ncbi:hypothetical protein BQ8794_140264 [Mesorhizobium prunaredense]|uniref:Uncharacterized protein n=1 Tax=Mesorhizobium prunaredense TaxID=1631249 RepID=A0A1R3V2P2_9HYPH|nr:hypothetical protein [Mesorhizobium prunaredense]SIT54119.1 hypothetical protein BQ8794_140264 [Mesorhizobium prunaredense]
MATGKDGGDAEAWETAAGQRGCLFQADTPDERVRVTVREPPFAFVRAMHRSAGKIAC